MNDVFNYMEIWVEEYMNKFLKEYDVCDCEICRKDVFALALNNLPPYYVVTQKGKIMAKYKIKEYQFETDIILAVTNAIEVVKKNPNH